MNPAKKDNDLSESYDLHPLHQHQNTVRSALK
jgi:hypothetical protein